MTSRGGPPRDELGLSFGRLDPDDHLEGEAEGTSPGFEEIFVPAAPSPPVPAPAVPSDRHVPPSPAVPEWPANVEGQVAVDDDNPLGDLGDRRGAGRRGRDAAASFEDLVSQMFVVEPEVEPIVVGEETSPYLWRWVAVAVILLGVGVAGVLYWQPVAHVLGLRDRSATVAVGDSPTVTPEPTVAVEPTPFAVVAEPVALPLPPTPEPVPPAPTPADVDPASLPAATRIVSMRWEPEGAGGVVILKAGGGVVPRRVRILRLEDPPRLLLRIAGITSPSEPDSLAVGGRLVARIRLGHHPELSPPELYVVVDLATPAVRAADPRCVGDEIRLPLQ